MKLYTVQPQEVINELNKNSIVYPFSIQDSKNPDDVLYKLPYQWLYNQMKIISPKNHAKVFEVKNGVVEIWEPVFLISLNGGMFIWGNTRRDICLCSELLSVISGNGKKNGILIFF